MGRAYKKGTDTYWKRCYHNAKFSAKYRNIDWQFTPQEWYDWWLAHGVDKNQPQQYNGKTLVMARFGDKGPYNSNNVYCCSNSQNLSDADYTIRKHPKTHDYKTSHRAVITEFGEFESIKQAAEHIGCDITTIYNRMKSKPTNYFYKETI